MEKLKLHTPDLTVANVDRISELFPNCVTEAKDERGQLKRAIDFDLLRQELSPDLVEGPQERYRLDWPGKREALALANAPVSLTLRPCREECVDFENTKNLFIEGDNLDALKLLQETYLGKVKMIYIDPPYNTGNDFIYDDNFSMGREDYVALSGERDAEGRVLFDEEKWRQNSSANGRFHSAWLSMMYPRLKLARNLLADDGIVFISIDDVEVAALQKLCDEIFGDGNFIACLPTVMNLKGNNDEFGFAGTHEYTLVFCKNKASAKLLEFALSDEDLDDWNEDEFGLYKQGANLKATGQNAPRERRPNLWFPLYITFDDKLYLTEPECAHAAIWPITNGQEMSWRWSRSKFQDSLNDVIISRTGDSISIYKKQRPSLGDIPSKKPKTLFYKPEYSSGNGTAELKALLSKKLFDAPPKPICLIRDFIEISTRSDDIILDFFSGSATTAHAVMQLNAEDGGKRRHIMVQLPEPCDEKSEAFKAGYKTIAEIGKERIRRAGKKILQEWQAKQAKEKSTQGDLLHPPSTISDPPSPPDIGFRVLKVADSNFRDIARTPDELEQQELALHTDHLKPDRTPEDLLFQVLVDWGVDLSLPIVAETLHGKRVFFVDQNALAACFDTGLTDELIQEIAARKPLRAVFRDDGFGDDSTRINVEQIFKLLSSGTEVRSL